MDGNAAPTAAAPGGKGSPDDDDADGMRTIIEAAIGLTSLGAPAPGPLARPPANENAGDDAAKAAPRRRTGPAGEGDGTATAAPERRRREPTEPASDGRGPPPPSILTKDAHVPVATGLPLVTTKNEKPKMTTTPPERRKPTADATEAMVAMMAAPMAAKARPVPSPVGNDRLPRLFVPPHAANDSIAMSQPGGIKSISFPPALAPQNPHFATAAVALGPMSYPPPGVADQDRLALPPKRQRVDHQGSWKASWEQQQALQLQQAQRRQAQQRREQGPREVSIWSRKQGYPSLVRAMAAADDAGAAVSGAVPPAAAPPTGSVTLNFPEILYEVLSDPANGDILAWLPHGRGFVIHDRNLFASEILPRKFDGAKFTSFTRRLKRWKFQRVPRGPEMGAYYNKYFVRDRPDLVSGMMYGMDEAEVEQGAADAGEKGAVLAGPPLEAAGRLNGKVPETEKPRGDDGDKKERKINKEEDGVATTAMELYRQQQRMKRRLKRDIDEEMVMRVEECGRGEKPRGGALAVAGEELRRQHEWLRRQLEPKDDGGRGDPSEEGVKEEKEETETEEGQKSEAVTSFGAAYDDAVVEAAMEAHRQRQQLHRQQHQQQLSTKKSDDERFQETKTKVNHQEDAWLPQQEREPRLTPSTPGQRRSSSSSEAIYPGSLNLGQRPHIEKNSKKEETMKEKKYERIQKSAAAMSFGVDYDDAVVEAAMNARRQKLQPQELRQPPTKEPDSERDREKNAGRSYQDTWLPPQSQEPRPPLPASRRSSSKIPSPASYNPGGDFNPPAHHLNVDQFHHRQQQQLELSRRRPSKESLSSSKSKPKQRQYQKPPNGSLHTSQPGYSRDSKKEGKKRRHQQQHQQHQSPPSATSNSSRSIPEELQAQLRNNLRTPYNSPYNPPYNPQEWQHQSWCQPQAAAGLRQESPGPSPSRLRERGPGAGIAAPYNPEDYLSISKARREALAAISMPADDGAPAARRGVGVLETATPSNRGGTARDGSEQQQYLKDIERQILSEISEYPLLRAASLSAPLSTRDYPRGDLGGAVRGPVTAGGYLRRLSGEPLGMAYRGNGMNAAIADQDRMLDRAFADARIPPRNIQGLLAGQDINEKILASSITHKQIMMMAARDLQSRGMGRQLGAAAALERHRLPPQEPPRQQPPLPREYLQAQQLQHLSQAQYPQMQGPPMPSTGMPSQQELPHPPRAGYTSSHAMMLRELEEKVERETLAAESAAAGLREREKRRGSGASAA